MTPLTDADGNKVAHWLSADNRTMYSRIFTSWVQRAGDCGEDVVEPSDFNFFCIGCIQSSPQKNAMPLMIPYVGLFGK